MQPEKTKAVEIIIQKIVSSMGFSCDVSFSKGDDQSENSVFNIKISDGSNFLIGQHGVNLQALQHITHLAIRKSFEEKMDFILDVNFYRQEKNQSIILLAREYAQRATSQKRSVMMKPLSAYERRLVHMELSKNKEVTTESIGDEKEKRIMIKPVDIL